MNDCIPKQKWHCKACGQQNESLMYGNHYSVYNNLGEELKHDKRCRRCGLPHFANEMEYVVTPADGVK